MYQTVFFGGKLSLYTIPGSRVNIDPVTLGNHGFPGRGAGTLYSNSTAADLRDLKGASVYHGPDPRSARKHVGQRSPCCIAYVVRKKEQRAL
jgi:hypothetical protein